MLHLMRPNNLQRCNKKVEAIKMKSIQDIKQDLEKMLSPKRYEHSVGVMEKAIELAEIYGEDKEKAAYAALTHDIAKEMTDEELINYAIENNIDLTEDDKLIPMALHGIIGSDIVKKKYDFTDEMCDAIYYHTTGRPNMTLIDKIIYVADKCEERTRISEHANKLREIVEEKGLDEAILFVMDDWTLAKAIENKKLIHPNTIYTRNDIISKLR